ncbi:MAG: adenylate/guanylate cyclase domain-containing protein [Deltaproteobacteria bacterium]|jgi:adenylate cyclase|nr:adenylate/guanylate cyclase domain-containing protein [Deltaproteobacteria bacterium]
MLGARIVVPLIVLAGVLALVRIQPTALVNLRYQAFDQLQRLSPRPYRDAGVRVIDLDDESLARIGQWPWPRSQVALLVDRLYERGVAAIAFDITFAEPDRTSPERLVELWPELATEDALREGLLALPDPDRRLAASIARAPVVTGFFLVGDGDGTLPLAKAQIHVGQDLASQRNPLRRVPRFSAAVRNLPAIAGAASGNGSANGSADPDGIHRRVNLLYRMKDRVLPSLALEALRVAIGGDQIVTKATNSDEDLGLAYVGVRPAFKIPTDPGGAVWIHYVDDPGRRVVPAWQVLEGLVAEESLAGTVVFVGTSAVGLRDQRPTPLDPYLPGVMLHAELAEHVVLGHSLSRPGAIFGLEWLMTGLLGLMVILLVRFSSALAGALVMLGSVATALGASAWAFDQHLLLVDPVTPSLAVFGVFLVSSVLGHLSEESQKRQVRDAFGHYLAPALVEKLSADPEQLKLGGEMRELSFLFCDVRGFTTLSERLEPEALTRLVNQLLTPLTEVILDCGGTIDKYMGDCVMAFWNAPLEVEGHAALACEAALRMLEAVEELNQRLAGEAAEQGACFEPLRVGVGVNTGLACVGNLGSEQRFDYSVIGDAVNLASRLEGQSKRYGVDVVIGEETLRAAPGFATLELDRIRVKGKEEPVHIHGLLGDSAVAQRLDFVDLRDHHQTLLKAYRAGEWAEVLDRIEDCVLRAPELEPLYDLYRERVARYRVAPPPAHWDGVFTATSK